MSKKQDTIGPLTYEGLCTGFIDGGGNQIICGRFLRRLGYYPSYYKTYYARWSTKKPKHNHYIVFEWHSNKAIVNDVGNVATTLMFDYMMKDTPTNIPLYGWLEEEV
jgi:hypothetical protein